MTLRHVLPKHAETPVYALALAIMIAGAFTMSQPSAKAEAATSLRYVRGYSVQGAWLCYGWANGVYHCTQHWTRSGGLYVSLNAPFVPSQAPAGSGGSGPSGGSGSPSVTSQSSVRFCTGSVDFSNASRWATPRGCYGKIFAPNPRNFPSRPSWGFCNWVAEESHLQFPGYAALHQTKHFGSPRVGAVVWFNPGVQGASSDGHWATLIAIGPNGWGLVEEMNFYFRGGGFARVDYRFIQVKQAGTAYLY
jgi:hypothetical protein